METKKSTLNLLPWVKIDAPVDPEERRRFFTIHIKTLPLLSRSGEDLYDLQKICSRTIHGCSRVKKQTEEQFFTLKNRHFCRFAPHNPYNNNIIIIIYRGGFIYTGYIWAGSREQGSKIFTEVAA